METSEKVEIEAQQIIARMRKMKLQWAVKNKGRGSGIVFLLGNREQWIIRCYCGPKTTAFGRPILRTEEKTQIAIACIDSESRYSEKSKQYIMV